MVTVRARFLKHPPPTCFLGTMRPRAVRSAAALWPGCARAHRASTAARFNFRLRGLDGAAELCMGMLRPDDVAHVPPEQRFTDGWRALPQER